jgi:dimethylargininase
VALICRPGGSRQRDVDTVRAVLRKEVGLTVMELGSREALLNASDVLFTGKEFFVGLGKETNMEGRQTFFIQIYKSF